MYVWEEVNLFPRNAAFGLGCTFVAKRDINCLTKKKLESFSDLTLLLYQNLLTFVMPNDVELFSLESSSRNDFVILMLAYDKPSLWSK